MGIRQEMHYRCNKCGDNQISKYELTPESACVHPTIPDGWVVMSESANEVLRSVLLCDKCKKQLIDNEILPSASREVVQ